MQEELILDSTMSYDDIVELSEELLIPLDELLRELKHV